MHATECWDRRCDKVAGYHAVRPKRGKWGGHTGVWGPDLESEALLTSSPHPPCSGDKVQPWRGSGLSPWQGGGGGGEDGKSRVWAEDAGGGARSLHGDMPGPWCPGQ